LKILTHSVPSVKIFDYSWKSLTYFFLNINLMAQSVSGNSLDITNLKRCTGFIVNLKQKWRSIIISSLLLPTFQVGASFAEPQGKPNNTGVGSLSLLQWIFPTQEFNQGLLKCRQILYQLSYQGSPKVNY